MLATLTAISLRNSRSGCDLIGKTSSDCKTQRQLEVLTKQGGPLSRSAEHSESAKQAGLCGVR